MTVKVFCSSEELSAHWVLSDSEIQRLKGKSNSSYVVFCVLLKYYPLYASFPDDLSLIPEDIFEFISAQIDVVFEDFFVTHASDRMLRRYYNEIRSFLGMRRFDFDGKDAFFKWALTCLFPKSPDAQKMDADIRNWFSENCFERPSEPVLSRLLGVVEQLFEDTLFKGVVEKLSPVHRAGLNNLLETSQEEPINIKHLKLELGHRWRSLR